MNDENMETIMGIIMESGNAKGFASQAIQAAKKSELSKAAELIDSAQESLTKVHNIQTSLLTKEANGENTAINLYMVHAQDWLMTSICYIDLAKEFVDIYKEIK